MYFNIKILHNTIIILFIIYTYIYLTIYLSTDEYSGCFHNMATVSNVATDMGVKTFL